MRFTGFFGIYEIFSEFMGFFEIYVIFLYLLDCLEIYEIYVFMRLMRFTNLQVISATNLLVERSIQEQIARGFPNKSRSIFLELTVNRVR